MPTSLAWGPEAVTMYHLRRATIAGVFVVALVLITWLVPKALNPTPPSPEDEKRDKAWVASSPYWVDRQMCRWFSVCGLHHMRWDDPVKPRGPPAQHFGEMELKRRKRAADAKGGIHNSWEKLAAREEKPSKYAGGQAFNDDIPDYVLRNAPLVHLYSKENFWPSDIAEHVQHMHPYVDKKPVNKTGPLSLSNLSDLNALAGMVFLTSQDDVEQRPEWLSSPNGTPNPFNESDKDNMSIPATDDTGRGLIYDTTWWSVDKDHPIQRISDPRERDVTPQDMLSKLRRRALIYNDGLQKPFAPTGGGGHKPDASGYSAAPAVLVLVDKGSGILDAFWFFFYSYNLGQTVLSMRFGNHVGDWEHCMVRFENGIPRAMFLSEHEGGQAYAWSALEKKQVNFTLAVGEGEVVVEQVERPVIYSAVGSHAMYAFPGPHAYVLPFKMLKDETDRGPLWDPSLNNYAYFYDYTEAPPPPEEDEGSEQDQVSPEESSAYPFNTTILESHADANATVGRRSGGIVDNHSLVPASSNPNAPTSWFHFAGPWGDELYSLGDQRQWRLFGQYHYVTGPMGPKFKRLGRQTVCQSTKCRILHSIEEGKKRTWHD